MFSKFFVYRPVFAWVISILIMLAGIIGIKMLPVEQYPDVAPPSIKISANYPGASAEILENSVTQVLEQQLTGLDGLLYFTSSSSSRGSVSINVTFASGTDPDIAQVQVQNKIQQAQSRLPAEVQQQGVTVQKSENSFLLIMALYDKNNKFSNSDIADWLVSNMQDPLTRVNGVGSVQVFGSQHAMRIWLNPEKLASYNLMPNDIISAIKSQNAQVTVGRIGDLPASKGQQLTATVRAQSRLKTVEQFQDIIIKNNKLGSIVYLKDVADVEIGSEDYNFQTRLNGHPAAGMAVMLAPGANALETSRLAKEKIEEFRHNFPEGFDVAYPKDNTDFIKISVKEVVKTLIEAIILVIIVMYVFMQNFRATLIPAIAVPVVLLGTFGILSMFGYSINTLTLFAMVLAIGLLVDDAIVVVENVERIMTEEKLSAKEATAKSMGQISGALIAIALVLSAVFLPMSFFGGSTGVIYRQFSITIISSMFLSVVVALTLTPALCGTFLKHSSEKKGWFFTRFNKFYENTENKYNNKVTKILAKPARMILSYGVIVLVMGFLMLKLPTGFIPTEDQGDLMLQYSLPAGATMERTDAVSREVEKYFLTEEKNNVKALFTISGFNFSGSGQNAGMAFIALNDWSERKGFENSAQGIANRAMMKLAKIRDASIFALVPPAIMGLGQSNGFTFELQAAAGTSNEKLLELKNELLAKANQSKELKAVRSNDLPQTPQLQIDMDMEKAVSLGVSVSDATSTMSTAWGGSYVNDFLDNGRVKKVYVKGNSDTNTKPEDLGLWFVRGDNGDMAPLSNITKTYWTFGPESLSRYNGYSSYEIQGEPAPGISSGVAMAKMESLANSLPQGTTWSWSGISLQEKQSSGQSTVLYSLSILVVFLCLAALYESWSVPISVLLVIPLGVLGAVLATWLRDLNNDVYFQVALLTTIGLSSKNAILIVEFAELSLTQGKDLYKSAIEAAKTRLRPILMTSLAFVAGVMPLALSTGAGANSRIAIGTGIIGGTVAATFLAIFFVPLFFVIVKKASGWIKLKTQHL